MCRLVRTACKHVHLNAYVPERRGVGGGEVGGLGTVCVCLMCNNTYAVPTFIDLEFRDEIKKKHHK